MAPFSCHDAHVGKSEPRPRGQGILLSQFLFAGLPLPLAQSGSRCTIAGSREPFPALGSGHRNPWGNGDGAGGEGKALENSKGQFGRYWLTGKIRVRRERVPWLDVNRKSG